MPYRPEPSRAEMETRRIAREEQIALDELAALRKFEAAVREAMNRYSIVGVQEAIIALDAARKQEAKP